MDFKDRLKELRKKRGLSQVALSERLGLSKSTIGAYETGDIVPSLEALNAIADFFNVDMDYLLGKKDVSTYILKPEMKATVDYLFEHEDILYMVEKMVNDKTFEEKMLKILDVIDDRKGE